MRPEAQLPVWHV